MLYTPDYKNIMDMLNVALMRFLAPLLFLAVTLNSAQAAELKVGVVDMAKAFAEYYKTKESSESIKVKKNNIQSELKQHYSTYQDLLTELSRLNNEVEDTSLTTEKRAKSKEAFSEKLKEARTMEKNINEFQQQRTMQLKQEEMSLMKELTEEIMSLVRDKCKSAGYDFVFDKSGIGVSSFPILIYYKDARDFTDEVIAELNKMAQSGEIGKQ